jgi:hypothetical protein
VGHQATRPDEDVDLNHVGHGRLLQGQGLLGGQRAQPQAQQVAALPAGHHRSGGRLRVDPDLGPGVGEPAAQLHGEVGKEHQLAGCPVGVAGDQLIQHRPVRLRDAGVQQRGWLHHQHTGRLVVAEWVQAQAEVAVRHPAGLRDLAVGVGAELRHWPAPATGG